MPIVQLIKTIAIWSMLGTYHLCLLFYMYGNLGLPYQAHPNSSKGDPKGQEAHKAPSLKRSQESHHVNQANESSK